LGCRALKRSLFVASIVVVHSTGLPSACGAMAVKSICIVFPALLALVYPVACILAEPHFFSAQLVDHFSTDIATFPQRYYVDATHFKGPGSPIFVILGGEGGISPRTGIMYPWVTDVLAAQHDALVLEPEHRFYGESLPFGKASFSRSNLRIMNSQQAIADFAYFIRSYQRRLNCTARGTSGYCPVLTIGGSYPGFLSAMMRLRYPAVVDMAYAASAPMRFYTQQVGQYEYYEKVTESAERASPGCPAAVRLALEEFSEFFGKSTIEEAIVRFSLCTPLPGRHASDKALLASDMVFLVEQTFANLNMANYPPGNSTGLARTCAAFVAATKLGGTAPLDILRSLLLTQTQSIALSLSKTLVLDAQPLDEAVHGPRCFDLSAQLPAGRHPTARCGDWSGCGAAHDGEMWDYQTCSFEVEHIGFNASVQMFPSRPWTLQWLKDHCWERFGVKPQPRGLTDVWGFDVESLKTETSRILFTNGLNDGWSVGGILDDIDESKGLISINFPNGAHHSDLTHEVFGERNTPDVVAGHNRAMGLIGSWLEEVRGDHTLYV